MYEEIQGNYPLEFALRDQDKYRYRYPKGEVSDRWQLEDVHPHQLSTMALVVIQAEEGEGAAATRV